ncbi:MAG: glycine--tRNA ligase [Acidobacteriota bacterium]
MDAIVALAKRRGFVFPASDIYGGINGFWDYGPLGVALKNNIRDSWWRAMVECPPVGPDGEPLQIVGLDSSIIQNARAWEASGHVGGFSDPMVDCRESKSRYRADQLVCAPVQREDDESGEVLAWLAVAEGSEAPDDFRKRADKLLKKKGGGRSAAPAELVAFADLPTETRAQVMGPDASEPGTLTEPREFNLMFQTYVGALATEDTKTYLRPETAQGIFLNFRNVLDTSRVKVPFGIAQVGKAFRNEVTPRNFIFRSREFEQMEMEFFCHESEARQWYDFWKNERLRWWEGLGVSSDRLRLRDHDEDELAHYSSACVDVEYQYPFTAPNYGELEGIAHRGCHDLSAHTEHSNAKLEYFDPVKKERFTPHVIEPASGLTRAVLVVLCEAYTVDETRPSNELMKIPSRLAPIKVGVFPLVAKDGLPELARPIYEDLRQRWTAQYDAKQAIGKRYARMDEAGTPYCVTVDGDTKADGTVTIRDRDTGAQERVGSDRIVEYLTERLG